MIVWLLFAVAAGIATWAAMAMRSGALDRPRGQPVMWGAGVTAAVLLALGTYIEVQQQRMMTRMMDRTSNLLDPLGADSDVRSAQVATRPGRFAQGFHEAINRVQPHLPGAGPHQRGDQGATCCKPDLPRAEDKQLRTRRTGHGTGELRSALIGVAALFPSALI